MGTLITAIAFSFIYFVELLVFGIGAFKEGGGRGLSYTFLAVILVLWMGFFLIRKRHFQYKTPAFIAFAVALSFWVVPASPIELAVERREDRKATEILRRIEVFHVTDEPLLTAQGKPLGIRMRYSVRFPQDGAYPPIPILTAGDEPFKGHGMRVIGADIQPRPEKVLSDAMSTGLYARYRGNTAYNFVVDLIPGFLVVSRSDKRKSCISFFDANEKSAVITNDARTKFSVHIDATDYGGYFGGTPQFTANDYSVREFYKTAVENGAKDTCVFDSRGEMQ